MNQLLGLTVVFLTACILPTIPFFPLRLMLLIPLTAAYVNPLLVTLVAAIGASLGTLPLYGAAVSAKDTTMIQHWMRRPWFHRLMLWLQEKMFAAILVVALLPIPDQLMSITSGLKRYPVHRFLLGFFLGRLPYFLLLAYFGERLHEPIDAARVWLLRSFAW